jgi:hypothetical protein
MIKTLDPKIPSLVLHCCGNCRNIAEWMQVLFVLLFGLGKLLTNTYLNPLFCSRAPSCHQFYQR